MNVDYNPFEGMEIEGRPSIVTVRGKVVVREGRFVGELGRGTFLSREPEAHPRVTLRQQPDRPGATG